MTWMTLGYRTALRLLVFALFLTCGMASLRAQTKDVLVSAAADMEPIFAAYAPLFEKQTGLKLKISYGSSAMLAQQIQNGSPADVFFSADFHFAEQVVAAGLTESKLPTPYAKGMLAVWTRKDSRFVKPLTIDVLSRKDLKSVAIANPERAPYGRAAVEAMRHMKLYDSLAPHFVQAESVAQAAQFALSGNAEIAFVSRTLAVSPKYKAAGAFVLIPPSQYPPITQTAVVLKHGTNREGAHLLMKFMLSDKVQNDLDSKGLGSVK